MLTMKFQQFPKLQNSGYDILKIGLVGLGADHDITTEDIRPDDAMLQNFVADASVIVCDLNTCCEASLLLLSLVAAHGKLEIPKTFIAISNPLVWARTTRQALSSVKGLADDQRPGISAIEQDSSQDPDGVQTPGCGTVEPLFQSNTTNPVIASNPPPEVTGLDYQHRVPSPSVESVFRAENSVIFEHTPGMLHTYVICPGVLYGKGECNGGFHDLFATAWQADTTTALSVCGSGENIIPTIHVDDCASFALQVARNQPDLRYLCATDDACTTQASIVQEISRFFANGETFQSDRATLYMQKV